MSRVKWHTETPPVGRWLVVWWYVKEVTARWDGYNWRDVMGCVLSGPITHWREG